MVEQIREDFHMLFSYAITGLYLANFNDFDVMKFRLHAEPKIKCGFSYVEVAQGFEVICQQTYSAFWKL